MVHRLVEGLTNSKLLQRRRQMIQELIESFAQLQIGHMWEMV